VAVDEGILGYCLAVGEPIHVQDVKSHPSFREDAFTACTGDVAALLSPLRHAGRDLGVLVVARRHEDGGFTTNDFAVFRSVAEQSSFAIGNARIHREAHEKRAMEGELQNAREVQRILLPQSDPVVSGFRISGTNLPARIISGDYYDYLDLGEGRFGIAIADVSGKGVPAGLLMAMCRSALRSVAPGKTSPSEVLAAVNRQLFPDIREDMFISMAYGILDESNGTLRIARAGHDPALLYRRESGTVELLRSPGLALGVDGGSVFRTGHQGPGNRAVCRRLRVVLHRRRARGGGLPGRGVRHGTDVGNLPLGRPARCRGRAHPDPGGPPPVHRRGPPNGRHHHGRHRDRLSESRNPQRRLFPSPASAKAPHHVRYAFGNDAWM
jgi:hypothetical protein